MTHPIEKGAVLVTGSTDGIGLETARELVRRGADVVLHGRNTARLEEAHAELSTLGGKPQPPPVRADLSALAEVRGMAEELIARKTPISVLINNAGVYMRQRELSRDGFEMTFAVNHYAPFLLTHLLLDALESSGNGRIVNVSSIAHSRGQIDFDDLDFERRFDAYSAYAASKLANVLFTVELAKRLKKRGSSVTVNALHPGVVSTKLLTKGFGVRGTDSLEQGATTSVYLATSPDVEGITGRYFQRARAAEMASGARDAKVAKRFYEESCRRVGIEGLPA